jgi:8-oxo-dGTP diphosphatase
MPFTYEYPRPSVTVDIAVFAERAGELVVLLIERKHAPFEGSWALPGGFVDVNEALEHAAARELSEETGLTGLTLTQVAAFGDPGRDPRGHTVSVAYVTRVEIDAVKPVAGDDAAKAEWHAWDTLCLGGEGDTRPVKLAFDHAKVLLAARKRLDGGGLGGRGVQQSRP